MSTNTLAETLFGKTRLAVLRLLCARVDEAFYLRQIARLTGVGAGAVQRELKNLTNAGIITRTVLGKHAFYRANRQCPAFSELGSLVAVEAMASPSEPRPFASGRAEQNIKVPHEKLAAFCQRHHITKLAFFGSVLRDDFRPDSDVDVLV